jgi:hypothetical protein
MTYRSKTLIRSAEGRSCALPECGSVGTTIAAHVNSVALGKGRGVKAPDYFTVHFCQYHHDLYDGRTGKLTKAEKDDLWNRAYVRTVARWFEDGIVITK